MVRLVKDSVGYKELFHRFHDFGKGWCVVRLVLCWLCQTPWLWFLDSKPDSNLGYPCQTRTELGEFWPPRRLHKSPELRNDVQNTVGLVFPSKETDRPFLGGIVSQGRRCAFEYARNDLVRIAHISPCLARRLDVKDQKEVIRLKGRLGAGRG